MSIADQVRELNARGVELVDELYEEMKRALDERDAFEERLVNLIEAQRLTLHERDSVEAKAADATRERDALQAKLDALTKPIAGVEELARMGWEAFQKAADYPPRPRTHEEDMKADIAEAQAIAQRVIGALRGAFTDASGHGAGLYVPFFDRAVASLKIEPEPTPQQDGPPWLDDAAEALGYKPGQKLNWSQVIQEIKALRREKEHPPTDTELDAAAHRPDREPRPSPEDTRPVVKVGQVWRDADGDDFTVTRISPGSAWDETSNARAMYIGKDGRPEHPRSWVLISGVPAKVKREPMPASCAAATVKFDAWAQCLADDHDALEERVERLERGEQVKRVPVGDKVVAAELERLVDIVDENFGMQPVMPLSELVTFLEGRIRAAGVRENDLRASLINAQFERDMSWKAGRSIRERVSSLKTGDGCRYMLGVIEASEAIALSVRGTGDTMPDDELRKLATWLEWRVGDGWTAGNESRYDSAVRALGVAATIEAIGHLGRAR